MDSMIILGLDLNSDNGFCDPAKDYFAGMWHEPRQARFRSTDATSAVDHISTLRQSISGRAQSEVVLLPGSIPEHGIRAKPDWNRQTTVCARALRCRFEGVGLPPSICVCRCYRGRAFVRLKPLSRCIRCSTCVATFPPSFISATARCTRSICSTS